MDSNANRQADRVIALGPPVHVPDGFDNRKSRTDGTFGGILERVGIAKIGNEAIAKVFGDVSARGSPRRRKPPVLALQWRATVPDRGRRQCR